MAKTELNIKVGSRLEKVRAVLGFARQDLADKIAAPPSRIRDYENGSAGISTELLEALAALGINLQWLLTGKGKMLLSKPQEIDENTTATLPVAEVEFVQLTQEELLRDIEEKLKNLLFQIQTVLHHD